MVGRAYHGRIFEIAVIGGLSHHRGRSASRRNLGPKSTE